LIKESKKTPVEVDKLKAIFFDNNKNYLEDVYVLNHKKYKVFYFEENEEILGYISTYYKKDFIKKEHLPIKLKFKFGDTYIWNMCVKSSAENKGVGSSLIKYVVENSKGNVYSIVNVTNIPSQKIHEKNKFEKIDEFEKIHIGKNQKFILYKHSK